MAAVQLLVFLACSALMIWRLGALENRGFEGTVLGTLVMPYCSGISNLIFAFVMGMKGGDGEAVLGNCLVNNVTNLTLLIGLPAMIWGMMILPGKAKKGKGKDKVVKITKKEREFRRLNRLELLLTLMALLFFTGALWAVSLDGRISFGDGIILVGIFVFWQVFEVFEVLKTNVRSGRSFHLMMLFDLAIILLGAYGVYISVDIMVEWFETRGNDYLGGAGLGWVSGWLMVLPNAMLAIYYSKAGRSDIAYSSQVGDGHICIPLCIGLFALFHELRIPDAFEESIYLLLGGAAVHLMFITILGRLPKWTGAILVASYGWFLYIGLVS